MVRPRVDVIHQVQPSTLKTYFQYLKPFPAAEGTDKPKRRCTYHEPAL